MVGVYYWVCLICVRFIFDVFDSLYFGVYPSFSVFYSFLFCLSGSWLAFCGFPFVFALVEMWRQVGFCRSL